MTSFRYASRHVLSCLVLALLMSRAPAAQAEKADRDKPTNIEADTVTVDDKIGRASCRERVVRAV